MQPTAEVIWERTPQNLQDRPRGNMLNCALTTLPKPSAHTQTLLPLPPGDSRSTSLQDIWGEDYLSEELALSSETPHELIALPPPAALTERPFPRSIALSYNEEAPTPRQPRVHQRSLTALLPFRPRSNSLSPERSFQRSPPGSPVKQKLDCDFAPVLREDRDGEIKIEEKPKGRLSGWFSGTSIPVAVGIQVGEVKESIILPTPLELSRSSSPERESKKLRKRPAMPSMDPTSPSNSPSPKTSRFSFFGSPKAPATPPLQIDSKLDDEFLNMDIMAALFPSGSPKDHDLSSASDFNNLVSNSQSLFCRLQTAYKLRTLSLHELRAEMNSQIDDLEEAETRVKHLKFQLEEMACKLIEQDEAMKQIVEELMNERLARAEEKEARKLIEQDEAMKQIVEELMIERLARAEEKEARENSSNLVLFHGTLSTDSESEHLHIELSQRLRPRRRSNGTSSSESYESDNESNVSHAETVFSRRVSAKLGSLSEISSPETEHAVVSKVDSNPGHAERSKAVRRQSSFRRILEGLAGDEEQEKIDLGMGLEDCRNCRGREASVAWDTVELLKAENGELKERVEGLQKAVEGTLELVADLGG